MPIFWKTPSAEKVAAHREKHGYNAETRAAVRKKELDEEKLSKAKSQAEWKLSVDGPLIWYIGNRLLNSRSHDPSVRIPLHRTDISKIDRGANNLRAYLIDSKVYEKLKGKLAGLGYNCTLEIHEDRKVSLVVDINAATRFAKEKRG